MHHPTDRIAHTTAFVTPVVEHWLEREIAQWVHSMKDRSDDPSHHERTLYLWATSRSPVCRATIYHSNHRLQYGGINKEYNIILSNVSLVFCYYPPTLHNKIKITSWWYKNVIFIKAIGVWLVLLNTITCNVDGYRNKSTALLITCGFV